MSNQSVYNPQTLKVYFSQHCFRSQAFDRWTLISPCLPSEPVDFPAITGNHLRQPPIDDPQHLLQLIMDDKIEVVANDTADGVVALSDTWNAEVNSLFLPCNSTLNIAGKTKTPTDKAISGQSHRLLTSEDVVREKLLLVQKKADKEQKKAETNLKRQLIKAKRVAK